MLFWDMTGFKDDSKRLVVGYRFLRSQDAKDVRNVGSQ